MKNEAAQPIVEVRNLKEYFNINMGMFRTKPLKAVDNVSFAIQPGETLGLVGESGCGKTTVGRTILHLYKPTGGEVLYKGRKIQTKADIQAFRNKASMVFQDPYSSLNPRMTVADIIGEPLDVHKLYSSRQERQERILELMGYVGLNSEHAARYAHEFSGGQRQRIGIARALAVNPDFIVCDEPVSALDVSIQAQVINMFAELQEKFGLTYLFIAHDLLVVAISPTASPSCTSARWSSWPTPTRSMTIPCTRIPSRFCPLSRSRIRRSPAPTSASCSPAISRAR